MREISQGKPGRCWRSCGNWNRLQNPAPTRPIFPDGRHAANGRHFLDNFGPFIRRYGLTDMYSAGFYPYNTEEEKWGFWSKVVLLNRYECPVLPMYRQLYRLLKDRIYFVLTTNVESQFLKAGFPKEKVFEVQGDFAYFQCRDGCHPKRYYNESTVRQMAAAMDKDCKVLSSLVPGCPVCAGPMTMNLRSDNRFVQDEEWYQCQDRYNTFLQEIGIQSAVLLELGVGFNTPGIIRFPFEQMIYAGKNKTLIRINQDHPFGPEENSDKTISFSEDMTATVNALLESPGKTSSAQTIPGR